MKFRTQKKDRTVWKLPKDVFGHFRKDYNLDISYPEIVQVLKAVKIYYLNEDGLCVNSDGSNVNCADDPSARYMWALLDGYAANDRSPIYVWMQKKDNGEFKNIKFGTKTQFDRLIVKQKKKLNLSIQ